MGSVAQITGNRYSFETIELFKEVSARLDREREAARAQAGDSPSGKIESYIVELHFSQLADESDRRFFNSVPTKLQLPSKTVDRLCQLAARQLADRLHLLALGELEFDLLPVGRLYGGGLFYPGEHAAAHSLVRRAFFCSRMRRRPLSAVLCRRGLVRQTSRPGASHCTCRRKSRS